MSKHTLTEQRRSQAIQLHAKGMKAWDIALELGVSTKTVTRYLREAGLIPPAESSARRKYLADLRQRSK